MYRLAIGKLKTTCSTSSTTTTTTSSTGASTTMVSSGILCKGGRNNSNSKWYYSWNSNHNNYNYNNNYNWNSNSNSNSISNRYSGSGSDWIGRGEYFYRNKTIGKENFDYDDSSSSSSSLWIRNSNNSNYWNMNCFSSSLPSSSSSFSNGYYHSRAFFSANKVGVGVMEKQTSKSAEQNKSSANGSGEQAQKQQQQQQQQQSKPMAPVSRVNTMSSQTKRVRTKKADGTTEEIISNKQEVRRSIKSGDTEVKTRSFEESVRHKDVHTENTTRDIHERRIDRTHNAISFKTGQNHQESDEKIDSKITERTITEHLDRNGNVEKTTIRDHQNPSEDNKISGKQNIRTTSGGGVGKEKSKGRSAISEDSTINTNASEKQEDWYTVGEPTPEEIAWRKSQITPYALVIHESRLLPAVVGGLREEDESGAGFTRRISSFVKRFSRRIRSKLIGEQSFEEITDQVRSKYKEVQEQIDNSQDPHLVALRNLLDRVGMQTEQSRAMDTLRDEIDDFWTEDFLPEFQERIWPVICHAYLRDDMDYLSKVCVGEALIFCRTMIDQRKQANRQVSDRVLWYDAVELVDTKLSKDRRPQLIVTASVHTVDCTYDRTTREIVEGSESLIANNLFYLILEPNVDEKYLQKTGHPWQIRLLQTSKQKQLV